VKLVCLSTELAGREFIVSNDRFALGRSPDCDVHLDHTSVSRNHAQISLEQGRYVVRDIKSMNGVQIDGKKVDEGVIGPGQILAIGDVQMQIVFDPPPMPPSTKATTRSLPEQSPARELPAAPPPPPAPPPAAPPAVQEVLQPSEPAMPAPDADVEAPAPVVKSSSGGTVLYALFVLVVLGLAGAYIILPGRNDPRRAYTIPVKMKRNEQRAVYMPRRYRTDSVAMEEEGIVKFLALSSRILILEAQEAGLVDLKMRRARGRSPMVVKVIIKGSLPDPYEHLKFRQIPDEKRLEMAQKDVARGETISHLQPYEALKSYEKAIEVLKPMPIKPPLYQDARAKLRAIKERMDKDWRDLKFAYVQCTETKNLEGARQKLLQMRDLIPDERDWHRQVVEIFLQDIDKDIVRQEKRRR